MTTHPDAERLALAALPAEPPDPGTAGHLIGCGACRRHVASMRAVAHLARTVGEGEPPDPPDRVWQAIAHELADTEPVARVAPLPRRPRRPRIALPVTAGLVATVIVIAGLAGTDPGPGVPTVTATARLDPLGGADRASAGRAEEVERDGSRAVVVHLDGVADLAGGDHLEAWLMRPDGSGLIALGNLVRDGSTYRGEFAVPRDLPLAAFPVVDVSAERWDGNPQHSQISLLRGRLA